MKPCVCEGGYSSEEINNNTIYAMRVQMPSSPESIMPVDICATKYGSIKNRKGKNVILQFIVTLWLTKQSAERIM